MFERLSAVWATASSTPWRRAPLLLWRRPGVLAAVMGATAVMVAAVASVPLFLSSAGTAAVELQVEERCPRDTGVRRSTPVDAAALRTAPSDLFRPLADDLTPGNRFAVALLAPLTGPSSTDQTTLLARDAFQDHVDVLEGGDGPGVWITDRAAERTGLAVGDTARVGALEVPVAAVYRDLAGYTVDRYWCSNADVLLVEARGGDLVLPPPVVLADFDTFADVMEAQERPFVNLVLEASLARGLTLTEADALVDELACHGERPDDLSWCAEGQPLLRPTFGPPSEPGRKAADDVQFVERYFRSSLPFVIDRSRAIQTAVGGGIWPVATLAALAGAGLVAAAASLWFDRRRREVVLLSVRGVSPLGLGAKAVLELLGPLVAGAAVGVALAYAVVVRLGPSPDVEPAAVGRAAGSALLALAGAALTVTAVVAARVRGHGEVSRRGWLGLVPWELALVAAAVVSYRRLGEWGVPLGRGAAVSTVDVWGLLFPVLFLLAAVALVSRLLGVALRPVRAVSRAWPVPLFLAVRRVARSRAASLGLVAATALASGVLVYAATMNDSLSTTLLAKARTFVGSDVAVTIPDGQALPASLAGRSTVLEVHRDAWIEDESVTVAAIDPATFTDAAFWDETFAGSSLDRLVERLAEPGSPVPAIVVGLDTDGPVELRIGQARRANLTIETVADVAAFPGMKRGKPTVYVAASSFDGELSGRRDEAWIAGDREAALATLVGAGIPYEETRQVEEIVDGSSFVTVEWTFGFMRSLGVAAGLLAIGGVAVHLDARRRERVLGHAFLKRMGLRARQHRRALFVELVASVLVGCWVGIGAALVGAWLAHDRIDPVPYLEPAPLLRVSAGAVLVAAVGAVVVVVLAAVLAQHRAEGDDPVEVLRAGA